MKKLSLLLIFVTTLMTMAAESHELRVQALTDAKGNTDVIISVDANPGFSVPDSVSHVQLKSFDTEGKLQWTQNEQNLELLSHKYLPQGNTELTYNDMLRYQPVRAQVQIKNPETNRTDVLRTDAVVLNRPDFTIAGIKVPHYAYVGEIVNIPTLVRELNGDLGAVSSLVLSANGAQIDSAHGVALNAAQSGEVIFSAIFEKPGTYTLTATAQDIFPGDFDYGNNSDSVTIEILDAPTAVSTNTVYSWMDLTEENESFHLFGYRKSNSYGQTELFGHSLTIPQALAFPLKYVRFNLKSDGNDVLRFDLIDRYANRTFGWGCTSYESLNVDLGDNTTLYVTSVRYKGCDRPDYSTVRVNKFSTDRHYFSESHNEFWGDRVEETHTVQGKFINAKKEISTNFVITDNDDASFGGNVLLPVIEREPYRYEWDNDYGNGYFSRGFFEELRVTGFSDELTSW